MTAPLSVRLETADDDRAITRELVDLEMRWAIPGGAVEATAILSRPLTADPSNINIAATLHVTDGRNAEPVFQGRLADPGRSARGWALRAEGPAAHAHDREVQVVYLDQSLELFLMRAKQSATAGEADVTSDDDGTPTVTTTARRGTVCGIGWIVGLENRTARELGQKLARFDYGVTAGKPDANWYAEAILRDATTGAAVRSNAFGGGTLGSQPFQVGDPGFTNGRDLIELRITRKVSSQTVADDTTHALFFNVALEMMRLTKSGVEITTGYTGSVLASSIVADLLGRYLTKYDAANASIAATTFTINQLAYADGTTCERILTELMTYEPRYYWAAWTINPDTGKYIFEWRAWPTEVRYEARGGDDFDQPGSDTELVNEVKVRWRDVNGRTRSVTRTNQVQVLDDAGLTITRTLDLGDDVGSSAAAAQIGDTYLDEHAVAGNTGTVTIRTPIWDLVLGRLVEPWEIRPGNLIRLHGVAPTTDALDATDLDGNAVFPIWAVTYQLSSNSALLDLQREPRTLSGLLARVAKRAETRRRR